MTTGLWVGKAAPFHKGHAKLVNLALEECDKVAVFIYNNKQFDKDNPMLDKVLRAYWVKELYPEVDVRIGYNPPPDDYTAQGDFRHGEYIGRHFEYDIHYVYGGEEWVDAVARAMGARPRHIKRDKYGISATKIRNNPMEYAWYMSPMIRDYMLLHYGQEQGLIV